MKKCKSCKVPYEPRNSSQLVCSYSCAISYANKLKEKKAKQDFKLAKDKIKTRSEWLKEAQIAFNAYIRARDDKLPCVSCGRFHQGQWHAGHYRTVGGNPELRFEELNVWKQCQPCNTHLHGNIVNYRIELLKRIGEEKLEWLEGKHEPKKYTIEELKEIKHIYKDKLKELTQNKISG